MQRYEHGGNVYAHETIRLDFSANINPLGMPPKVREAIIQHADAYAAYPDPFCRALCNAIAAQEGVLPEYVLCGNGAADLIIRLCLHARPRQALVLAPTFSEYEKAVLLAGGKVRYHMLKEEDGFAVTESILDVLSPGIDMVFLCNPNNPTGQLIAPALLEAILEKCCVNDTLLVVDECFLDFTDGNALNCFLEENSKLILLRAFTKMYAMAGLRLGYLLCANEALLQGVRACGQSWSVSTVAQVAGLAAVSCKEWAANTRTLVQKERAYLRGGLQALGLQVYPSEANFLLLKSGVELYAPLLQRGILVRPCGNYVNLDDTYTRIAVRTHEENKQLLQAIEEVLHG